MSEDASRLRFLFRQDQGRIGAMTWRLHAGWLAALTIGLTAIWLVLRPYAHHDLKTQAFIQPMTILAFAYLIVFSFVLILISVSYTMLSIKRMRDRLRPPGLAGLVPLFALMDGSLHFLRDQTPDVITIAYVVAMDVALAAIVVWTIVELGVLPSRDPLS